MSTGSRSDREGYELWELLGLPMVLTIEGVRYEILPITLEEFPYFCQNMKDFQNALDAPDDVELKIVGLEAELKVIEQITRQSVDVFISLDEGVQKALVEAGKRANKVLFDNSSDPKWQTPGTPRRPRIEKDEALDVMLASLVEAGHRLEQIKRYTLTQVAAFSHAHGKLASERQIRAMVASRAAHLKSEDFRRLVSDLQPRNQAMPRGKR